MNSAFKFHERIRAVYESGVGNGQVKALALEIGLAASTVSIYAIGQGWGTRHMNKSEAGKALEMRERASLHCVHFQECLDKAAKNNKGSLECHKCEKFEFIRDHYHKEINLAGINNQIEVPHSVSVGNFECKPAPGINGQSNKQGRKIMEEYTKDERPTSNIERPMMNEKDKGEEETRVCSQADCEHGGKPQPIENFGIHPPSGKRKKMCNTCFSKKLRAGQQRRHERRKEKKKKGKDERPTSNSPEASKHLSASGGSNEKIKKDEKIEVTERENEHTLTICFESHQEIYKELIELAEAELRTPGNQTLYMLRDFFEEFKQRDAADIK